MNCKKCHKSGLADKDFYVSNSKLDTTCKECRKARVKELSVLRAKGVLEISNNEHKVCPRCGVEKTRAEFHLRKGASDGLASHCKACRSNDENRKSKNKEYYQRNKDHYKQWRDNNRPYLNAYEVERRNKNPTVRLVHNLRTNMYNALNRVGVRKSRGCLRNLNYTSDDLRAHIDKKLEECGYVCPMCKTYDLNNGFDVDHVIPLSSVNTEEETIQLFALDNLDVLCPTCNRNVKSDKLPNQLHQLQELQPHGHTNNLPINIAEVQKA